MGTENLENKVVIVTGASSGIGEAIARELAGDGCRVMLVARREERLKSLASELGDQCGYFTADVTKLDQVKSMASTTLEKFGQIDVIINNAGVMPVAPMSDLKVDDWHQAIDVNINGVLHGIAAVLPHMLERGSGQVINIGSVASLKVFPGFSVYCGTKFAVKAISEGLRQETAGKLRVTTIYPGAVESELIAASNDQERADQLNENFEFISPTAISRAVRYAIEQPEDVSVNEITVRPTSQEL